MSKARAQHGTCRPMAWRRRLAGLSLVLAAVACTVPARAQSGPPPRISVPETVSLPASSQAPLRIAVSPSAAIPRNAFIRIRGLPPMAALSDGHTIAPGAWAVSLAALPDLRITVPGSATGRATVVVTLVSVDGAVISEAQTTLVVGSVQPPASVPGSTTVLRAAPSNEIAAVAPEPKQPPALKPEDRERAMRLVKRGQQFIEDSNVSEARLLFEKAADLGLAEGAIALASTFDEPELARLGVRGVQADAKEARRWYERAAQLGAKEAQQRLQRLGAK